MPRHPRFASALSDIGGSVFSALAHRMALHRGEVYPLHVGDTWAEPADGTRMQDLSVTEHPGMHRYAPPRGLPALVDAVVDRVRVRMGISVERRSVLITAGATGALGAVFGAILEAGDEVLIAAPYWPLITGIVRCCRGKPVAVPLIGEAGSAADAVERMRRSCTRRTVAIYLSTPNNPTGRVLAPAWIEALVRWAREENLWVVSDEVYEDYVYDGSHAYAMELDPGRTFSAHSFSKAFGMAGNRCGYVLGPADAMAEVSKVSTHSFYSSPTASQLAAVRALDGRGDAWVREMRERYRQSGEAAARRLGVDAPEGSTFLFLDLSERLDERGLIGLLEDCADRGLFLAPGPSFGPYPNHARVCFTSAPPDVVRRGVDVLAELLGR